MQPKDVQQRLDILLVRYVEQLRLVKMQKLIRIVRLRWDTGLVQLVQEVLFWVMVMLHLVHVHPHSDINLVQLVLDQLHLVM